MNWRILPIVLVLLVAISLPTLALNSRELRDYNTSPRAISWRESDTIYVGIVNDSNSRQNYRIEVYDIQRRSNLARRDVIIPAKSILVETFTTRDLSSTRFPIEEVTIYEGTRSYYSRTIKIQDHDLFMVDRYIIPTNTSFSIEVDLARLSGNASSGRITIDNDFTMYNSRRNGGITANYNPGMNYLHRNVIEYGPPTLTLSMRSPSQRDVDFLSFEMAHRPVHAWRDELIAGPILMVYGGDYRLLGYGSSSSSSSGSIGNVVER